MTKFIVNGKKCINVENISHFEIEEDEETEDYWLKIFIPDDAIAVDYLKIPREVIKNDPTLFYEQYIYNLLDGDDIISCMNEALGKTKWQLQRGE